MVDEYIIVNKSIFGQITRERDDKAGCDEEFVVQLCQKNINFIIIDEKFEQTVP